jgi:hypothetical protein
MELGGGSPRPLSGVIQGVDARGWMRSFACADEGWMVVMWPRSSITLPGG